MPKQGKLGNAAAETHERTPLAKLALARVGRLCESPPTFLAGASNAPAFALSFPMAVLVKKSTTRRCWLAGAVVAALALSGCKSNNLRGGNFRDEWANWGESNKRPGAPDTIFGYSKQAQQVEKNLGVD